MTTAKNLFRRRRLILKSIIAGLFLLPLHAFISMVKTYMHYLKSHQKPMEIPSDVPEGVSFQNKIILVRNHRELTILSAKCTHLGCTIDRRDGDSLICPCHGSRYSFSGKILKGPALKNLQTLNYKIDSENRKIIIDLPT